MVALSEATGVSLEWLAAGRGDMRPPVREMISMHHQNAEDRPLQPSDLPPAGPDYVPIPRYNVQASAGDGSLADNPQIVEFFAFDREFIRNKLRREPQYLLLVEARGDSMAPTILDGDVLTVDVTPGQVVEHGALYVLRIADNLLVKRVEQRVTGLILHSENPRYTPEHVARADADQLQVIGRVLLVISPPR